MDRSIGRRRLLQGGAAGSLGIATMALPGATAAASTFWWTETSGGLTAPTYSGSDVLLAEWSPGSPSTMASLFPTSGSSVAADYAATNVGSSSLTLVKGVGDDAVYSSTIPNFDTDSPVGSVYPLNEGGRLSFIVAEPSTTVRVDDGPYLQISFSASSGFLIYPRALVFSAALSAARLSVRSDADNDGYATSIRDFGTPRDARRNVVVNLEGLAAFTTRTFRLYPFATGTANQGFGPMNRSLFGFTLEFNDFSLREPPLIPVLDDYNARQNSVAQPSYSATIGLIGTVAAV